ncbi:MAG: restriction endonuclease subunit S, partial [Bacteroidales bacterium]|nr:restriction endonuclease subunit S [Bacteroidales bacterium]
DGFDLGAQRRPIKLNDLPEAYKKITAYKNALRNGEYIDFDDDSMVSVVSKKEIGSNGEYNLGGERYKQPALKQSTYNVVKIGEVFKTSSGGTPSKSNEKYWNNGTIPWLKSGEVAQGFIYKSEESITGLALQESSAKIFPVNSVLIAMYGATAGQVGLLKIQSSTNQAVCAIYPNENTIPEYLYYLLKVKRDYLVGLSVGGAQPNISQTIIKELKIPLPPLSVQEEIVAEIERYQQIIDGARQVVNNYKPRIDIDPNWEMVELGEVCEVNPKKSEIKDLDESTMISFVPMAVLNENQIDFISQEEKPLGEVFKGYTYFRDNDVLIAKVTPCFENGKAGIANNLKNGIGFGSSEYYVLRPNNKILSVWIYLNLTSQHFMDNGKSKMTGTGGLQRVPRDYVSSYKIPLPSVEIQQQIVTRIEKEQVLVNANKQLIELFEQRIKDRMAKVWGE